MRLPLLAVTALLLSSHPGHAQTTPTFDIAVIHPTDLSNAGHTGIHTEPTELRTEGTTPRVLLQLAFDIPRDLIFGLPGWAETTRLDLTAKDSTIDPAVAKTLPENTYEKMLQTLLAERFALKYHTEMREVTAYELVYVRPAPALKKVDKEVDSTNVNNQHMEARGVSLVSLAKKFGDELHRPVVDHTGLKGFYDVELRWRRDDEAAAADAANNPDAPPILLTAVPEQLGLKLRSGKFSVPVLIVDKITPPTSN